MSNNANDPALRSVAESFDAAAQVLDDAIPEEVRPSLLPEAPNDSSQHSHRMSVVNKINSLAKQRFPILNIHPRPLTDETQQRLIKLLQLPPIFFERLKACGYTLPHRIVNAFGGDVKTVATAFGEMQPILLYGQNANTALMLVKFAKQERGVSPTIEEFSETMMYNTRLGRKYSKTFDALSKDEIEDKIEDLFDDEDMELYKTFMRKVRRQLKQWLIQESSSSKIETLNSVKSNVSSIKGSIDDKQVLSKNKVDCNSIVYTVKQSLNQSLFIRKPKVLSLISTNSPEAPNGADVHDNIANNIAQNSFTRMPSQDIANNDSNNVSTTVPKYPLTWQQSFYHYCRKFIYNAPKSEYNDRKYVKDMIYLQNCNANVRWKNDEHSNDDLLQWKKQALQWDPGGVSGEHMNKDSGEKVHNIA